VTTDGVVAHIAFFDTPVQHIVMGHTQAIEHMRELASASKGVQISDAPVELGLHSPLMDSVVSYFKLYLEKVDFKDLIIPLATDADAKIVTQGDRVKAALVKQINSPVQWHKVISLFDECDVIVEVGPGTHLTTMLQTQYPEKKSLSINKRADVNQLKKLVEQQQAQAEG
jgi:[acyl-carrier-protein] S-malonyltransferase